MAQEIARVERITTSDIMSTAKAFYESGMFTDIKSAAQAVVKITAGQELGIPPFASMSGIHIIQGKPTVGAGLMAARVKGSGKYDYKVVEQTEKLCSIDFYQGKEKIGNSTFTLEDAKKAQTKNLDKFARNMLFARAMSNGVKWYTPDIFAGPVYVPEEMQAPITEDVPHTVVETKTAAHNPAKKPITAVQFNKIMERLSKEGEDIQTLVEKTMAAFEMTDEQAEAFTAKVAELQTPA